MGQAKRRGTFDQRKAMAFAQAPMSNELGPSPRIRIRNATRGTTTTGEQFIITFLTDCEDRPRFLGSGCLISKNGLFVTAKHIFFEDDGTPIPLSSCFAMTFNANLEPIQSKIVYLKPHPDADVAIGIIEPMDPPLADLNEPYDIEACSLDLSGDIQGGNVFSYAFPKSLIERINGNEVGMRYVPSLYQGKILNHADRSALVNNIGYDCEINQDLDDGASGAPVFLCSEPPKIIGVNSTGIRADTPGLFASDIILIKDLTIRATIGPSGEVQSDLSIGYLQSIHMIR